MLWMGYPIQSAYFYDKNARFQKYKSDKIIIIGLRVMWYFFRQADEFSTNHSAINAELVFRDQKISGLIEKRINDTLGAVMVFAGGIPAGAYELEDNLCKPISLADFAALKIKSEDDIRAIKIPNRAMRMVWLSLESQVQEVASVQVDESWKGLQKVWEDRKWNGLIEVRSETFHGFAMYWEGVAQKSDIFFSTPQGFTSEFCNVQEFRNLPRKVITFSTSPSAQAYRCALLRQGCTHWSNRVLSRYQEMVGQRLLQSMERELNRLVQPWEWEIMVADGTLVDSHFFLHTDYAAHAYRAILMSMGTQMNFVIGNNLTQKILTDTFEDLPKSERSLLLEHRLIPAAFSE
jgi:hypothetical protein